MSSIADAEAPFPRQTPALECVLGTYWPEGDDTCCPARAGTACLPMEWKVWGGEGQMEGKQGIVRAMSTYPLVCRIRMMFSDKHCPITAAVIGLSFLLLLFLFS